MGVIMPPMDIPYVAGFPPPVPDEHAVFYIPNGYKATHRSRCITRWEWFQLDDQRNIWTGQGRMKMNQRRFVKILDLRGRFFWDQRKVSPTR